MVLPGLSVVGRECWQAEFVVDARIISEGGLDLCEGRWSGVWALFDSRNARPDVQVGGVDFLSLTLIVAAQFGSWPEFWI